MILTAGKTDEHLLIHNNDLNAQKGFTELIRLGYSWTKPWQAHSHLDNPPAPEGNTQPTSTYTHDTHNYLYTAFINMNDKNSSNKQQYNC